MGELRQALVETLEKHRAFDVMWSDKDGPAAKWQCTCGAQRDEPLRLGDPADMHMASVVVVEAREHVADQLGYAVNRWLKEAGYVAA